MKEKKRVPKACGLFFRGILRSVFCKMSVWVTQVEGASCHVGDSISHGLLTSECADVPEGFRGGWRQVSSSDGGSGGLRNGRVLFLGHKRLEEPDWATWSQ